MFQRKKLYSTPQLKEHGSLVQLTADYVPGIGHVANRDPKPPVPIVGPVDPGGGQQKGQPQPEQKGQPRPEQNVLPEPEQKAQPQPEQKERPQSKDKRGGNRGG